MIVSMKEILDKANEEEYAVAAPNVVSELDARAALEVAEELKTPIILDVSFRTNPDMEFFGKYLCCLAQKASVPVAVNMDHGAEYEKFAQCILAIRAGFTAVMVDRSDLAFEDNVAQVKELVKIAHSIGITVEAELGHVGVAQMTDDSSNCFTNPKLAGEFVELTGIDCLAVSIGNAHGAYKGIPKLDIDRLKEIKCFTKGIPLVLHGSSGISESDLKNVCRNGINKVNVNFDLLKGAYDEIIEANLSGNDIYKLWALIRNGYKKRLRYLIQECYGSEGKAWEVKGKGLKDVALAVRYEVSSPLCLE